MKWAKTLKALALLAVPGLIGAWFLSAPRPIHVSSLPAHTANLENGKLLYNAGGCYSCHLPGPEAKPEATGLPVGGTPLKTPIGTLFPPNLISSDLRNWTDIQFVNAMQRGISPDGRHYIPAFPYTSYAAMKVEDILDIKAHLASLTSFENVNRPADIPLSFVIRRGLGLWKHIGLDTTPWAPDPTKSASWNRGSYLVNGPGHCNECHTPRTIFMTSNNAQKFVGGPHPEGIGKVPSLRDLIGRGRYKDIKDLATAFQFGEEFGYSDMSSGGMGKVQSNLSKLPEADILAIAEYVASLK
jgi:mono/diheme cytochrome c family protein